MEGERGLCCGVRGGWGRSALGEQESWTPEGMWGPLPVPLTLTSIAALGSAPRSFLCRPSSHWGPSSPSLGPVLPLTGAHPPHCHWGSVLPSLGPVLPAVTRGPSSLSLGAHPPPSLGPILPRHWGPSSPSLGPILPRHWGPSSPSLGPILPHHWGPSSPSLGAHPPPSLGPVLPSVMSDSSKPHRLQPTRLLRPWDFPGKSTGVGCHCLLHFCHQVMMLSMK